MVATTLPDGRSTTLMLFARPFATYSVRPSGDGATPTGRAFAGRAMAFITRCRSASTTDTVWPISAVTYARFPSGENAAARGLASTRKLATTLLDRVSITDTVLLVSAVT